MQLRLSLSTLLAGVLLMLSMQAVESLPLSKRSPKFVTLPLKRVEQARGLHPQIYLQQHINRSIRRLARMTGRSPPSRRDLQENLERRVLAVEGPEALEKRFNRMGVPKRRVENVLEKRFNRIGVPKKAKAPDSSSLISLKKGKNSTAQAAPVTANAVAQANAPTAANSLGLDIEAQDVGYLATVQMGTPPRNFLILMDSGSADLWVGAENCQSQAGGGCGNHVFLGAQSSSTFTDTGNPFSVTYGTGQVSGDIITDNVNIAGLALNAHTFGVASSESVDFSSNATPFDGLMGLAQSTLSEQKTPTPVESLATAGLIPDSITSFKISRLADNKNDGEITFGALDTTKFNAQTLVTVPNVNTQGFWEGALDAVTVDGTDTGLTGRTAILDTGSKSDGQGGFTVPCTTTASVALTFGGQAFAIDPRDIAFQPVNANNPTGDCVSGITSGQIGGATEWLVGDVFLKNAYFSTDVSKNTVSLATLV
ncbi:aspartic peptidase A1 [Flammula alnicola]|nr:aspartic peptidase A1 [Flammula alnicola]